MVWWEPNDKVYINIKVHEEDWGAQHCQGAVA